MKNTFKKMAALLMAVAMVITSMSISAFAAASDTSVSITGVDSGTVTLYKIVKEDNGAWKQVYGNVPANIQSPTEEEIAALSQRDDLTPVTGSAKTADGSKLTWTNLEPGMYMALVTKSATGSDMAIYAPMLLSVDYDVDNPTVDANKDNKIGSSAVAKKYTPDVTKTIVNSTQTSKGDTVAKDDVVKYQVVTTIPAYASNFTDPEFFFSDALGDGLKEYKAGSLQVTEAGKTPTYEFTDEFDGKSFRIKFTDVEVGKAARTITITYEAYIDHNTNPSGFDPRTNTAKIEYSHIPGNESNHREKEDKTHHYTFNIDQHLEGYEAEKEGRTSEIVKVEVVKDPETGEEIEVEKVISSETWESDEYVTERHPLAGAVFALKNSQGEIIRYAKSDASGKLVESTDKYDGNAIEGLTGLDCGTYTLEEVQAPAGYAKITRSIATVIISAEVNAAGELVWYTIDINGAETTYKKDKGTIIREGGKEGKGTTTRIENREVGSLPSTGGMGTVIFTIVGIAVMAIAAGLFIANKKASK